MCNTRAEAREAGASRYNTGKPCKNGHLCERFTGSGGCVQCGSERSAKWYLTWTPEKVIEKRIYQYVNNQTEQRREYMRQYMREYRAGLRRKQS